MPDSSTPIIDPQFSAFCRHEPDTHYAKLEKKLLAEGCQDKLVTWRETGILLDGHTRLAICQKHGIDYDKRTISLPSRAAAMRWIFDHQDARRNWTIGARAMAAADLKEEMAKEAAERQAATQFKAKGAGVVNLPPPSNTGDLAQKGKSRDMAGEATGVSPKTVQAAATVKAKGTPELQEAVRSGRVSVSKAARIATSQTTPPDEPFNEPAAGPVDALGKPLPDKQSIRTAFARAGEVKAIMQEVSKLKGKLIEAAARKGDPIFAKLDVSAVVADLQHVFQLLKAIKPFAICCYCAGGERGSAGNCSACSGLGWLSEYAYRLVPREIK